MTKNSTVRSAAARPQLFHTLRSKILISFGLLLVATLVLVSLVRTFGIPFTRYSGTYGFEQDEVFRNLGLIADLKKERLALWIMERKNDARLIGDMPVVESCVRQLRDKIREGQRRGAKPDTLQADLIDLESYKTLTRLLQLVFGMYSAYHDIQVADAKTGVILASTNETEVGTEIGRRQILVDAAASPQGIAVEVSKSLSGDKPYLVICSAVTNRSLTAEDDEIASAVFFYYVDADEFVKPLLYTGEGLGQSGDIVLVNKDQQILLSPKYPLPDGTVPKVLEYRVETEPARLAAQGQEGIVLARDYRGVPVLAAYRSLLVTPDVAWGMVVKRDEAEVLRPVWKGLAYSVFVGLVALAVGLLLVVMMTNKIARPIEDLSRAARQIESGDLTARAQVMRSDEVGGLATAFNSMIERVANWHKELEEQVKARTTELSHLNEFLMAEVDRRRRAETELALEKERLATTLGSIGDGVISTDTQGRILSLNDAAEQLTGWPEKEALGRLLQEVFWIVNEQTRKPCENPVHKVLRGGALVGLANDTLLIARDGAERVIADSAAPIRAEDGSVLGVVLVFRDVTESRRAAEELRSSLKTLAGILSASPVGIGLTVESKIAWGNYAGSRMFGYGHESEYVGRPTGMLFASEEEYQTARAALYRQIEQGKVGSTEATMKRADGSLFHGLVRSTLVDPSDPGKGTISAVTDISEIKQAQERLRESEERYRRLVDLSPDPIAVHSGGKIVFVNRAVEALLGCPQDQLIGKPALGFVHPDDREKVIKRIQQMLEGHKAAPWMEERWLLPDGTVIEVEVAAVPITYGGKPASQVVVRDMSERKKAEQERENLRAQLLQAQKMEAIGTLAGGIAHEFNNLLQVTLGYSDLLLLDKDESDPEYADLQKIVRAARTGADLVKRLLAFSRKAEFAPRPLNLNRQIEHIRTVLTRTIPKMIEIEPVLADNLAKINADPTQIEQIIMNLAVNARDAMPDGGKLTIETREIIIDDKYSEPGLGLEPGKYVMLCISDTGHGMDADTVSHIFDPFFTTKEVGHGTGLGLAVVYGIVQQHGGTIKCLSEPGRGTKFIIYFPAMPPKEQVSEEKVEKAEVAGGIETILLVDDEPFIRDLGVRILSRSGYTVRTADTGPEALEIYRSEQENISLVILDLIMPEMSGKQCLEELLKMDPDVKVLIASGYSAEASIEEMLEAGAMGFVRKPYDFKQLLGMVRDVLETGAEE